jgi:hypothetical protein
MPLGTEWVPVNEIYVQILYTLHSTTKQFGMKIPPLRFKVMAFKEYTTMGSTNCNIKQVLHWKM